MCLNVARAPRLSATASPASLDIRQIDVRAFPNESTGYRLANATRGAGD